MPDKNNAQTPTGNPDGEPFPPTPIIAPPEERVMADNGTPKPNDVQADTKKKLHWLETGYFSSQIILAGIGIWALAIYHGQLVAMHGQLDEMKRSGEQSTQQMWSAIGNVNWMARSMDWNQKDSHNSIQATIDQFHEDQRPWIAIQEISCAQCSIKPGTITISNVRVVVVNTGKTPALHMRSEIIPMNRNLRDPIPTFEEAKKLEDNPPKPVFTTITPEQIENSKLLGRSSLSETNLPPNIPLQIFGWEGLTWGEAEDLIKKNGRPLTYLLGKIVYFDTLQPKVHHVTMLCAVAGDQASFDRPATFHFCSRGNIMK